MGKHKRNLFKKMYLATRHALLKFYMSVNYSSKVFNIDSNAKCLCLAPHQDDETIGMGGTLAKHAGNFEVICLTNGAKGFADAKRIANVDAQRDEVLNIRQKEFADAMNIAGIKNFKILDIEDRSLAFGYNEFVKNINFNEFDFVFIPNIIDQHKDHKAVTYLLYKYLTENEVTKDFKICFYEVWSALGMVNSSIDITDFVETKIKMLEAYPSQTTYRPYTDAAIGLNKYRGLANNKKYAEAFLILSQAEFLKLVEEIYPLIK